VFALGRVREYLGRPHRRRRAQARSSVPARQECSAIRCPRTVDNGRWGVGSRGRRRRWPYDVTVGEPRSDIFLLS
jgi:hypothetical protein